MCLSSELRVLAQSSCVTIRKNQIVELIVKGGDNAIQNVVKCLGQDARVRLVRFVLASLVQLLEDDGAVQQSGQNSRQRLLHTPFFVFFERESNEIR